MVVIIIYFICSNQSGKYQVKDMDAYIEHLIDELLKLWNGITMLYLEQYDKRYATILKNNCCRHIRGIIIANIMCSLFIDNSGGMLLLITKIGKSE